jgi:CHAD domain-containing protein
MPFRFKKTESPGKAVRRVVRERIGAARDRLRHSNRPAAVHGVRKEIKKLRAVFRLVRDEIGNGIYRKGAKALREAAKRLAPPRDARVRLKAFEELTGRAAGKYSTIHAALKKHAHREARRFQKKNSVARAERLLRKTDRRVDDLKIKSAGWAAMQIGLAESYRRGRAAWELAVRKQLPENFHEWRKHVKDLWYYSCLLQPVRSTSSHAMTDNLELLGEQLGEDHDLFLLQQFLAEQPAEASAEVAELGRLITARQKKLRAAALKLGSRLYADQPELISLGHNGAGHSVPGNGK